MTGARMTRIRADILLVAAAAIWGFAYLFQKTAMADIGPLTFVASRAIIATLCLAVIASFEARRAPAPMPRSLIRTGILAGVLFFVAAALQQAGLVTATITNTGFLTALYVVTTPLMAWLVFRRFPNAIVWPAVLLAFIGVWLLGGGSIAGLSTGDMLVAASALGWSAHLLVVSRAASHGRPIAFTAIQFAAVAVCAVPLAIMFEPVSLAALTAAAPSILFVGVLSSALTFTIFAAALRHTPPGETTILVSTEVLFAAAAGAIFLGDRLTPIGWIGAALMFAATLLVQVGPWLMRGNAAPVPVEPAVPPDTSRPPGA
jgi:drug/metabolite transporter (DMT)-like permease